MVDAQGRDVGIDGEHRIFIRDFDDGDEIVAPLGDQAPRVLRPLLCFFDVGEELEIRRALFMPCLSIG